MMGLLTCWWSLVGWLVVPQAAELQQQLNELSKASAEAKEREGAGLQLPSASTTGRSSTKPVTGSSIGSSNSAVGVGGGKGEFH